MKLLNKKIIKILALSSILILSFSCNTRNNNLIQSSQQNTINSNTTKIINISAGKKITNNYLKFKFKFDSLFNLNAYTKRFDRRDIKSIQIRLVTDPLNPLTTAIGFPFDINVDNDYNSSEYIVNITNLKQSDGIHYAVAKVFDGPNGTGNNLIKNNAFSVAKDSAGNDAQVQIVSGNNISMTSPYDNIFLFDISLEDSIKDNDSFEIGDIDSNSREIMNALDGSGTGVIAWISGTKKIRFRVFENYIPKIASIQDYDDFDANVTSINSAHVVYAGNNTGLLAVTRNKTTTIKSDLQLIKFTIDNLGSINFNTPTLVDSTTSAIDELKDPYIKINSSGKGAIVYCKKASFFEIITQKIDGFSASGAYDFFSDNLSDKSKPIIDFDNKGEGIILWNQDNLGVKNLLASRLINYNEYNNGFVNHTSLSNSVTLASGADFFQSGLANSSSKTLRIVTATSTVSVPEFSIVVNNVINPYNSANKVSPTSLMTITNQKFAFQILDNANNIGFNMVSNSAGESAIIAKSDGNSNNEDLRARRVANTTIAPLGKWIHYNDIITLNTGGTDILTDNSRLGLHLKNKINIEPLEAVTVWSETSLGVRKLFKSDYSFNKLGAPTPTLSSSLEILTPNLNTSIGKFSPNLSLNNSGSGLVSFIYDDIAKKVYCKHIKEYVF